MNCDAVISFIRKKYPNARGAIPLHAPVFHGNEKKYLQACIDSTFVSTIGQYVTKLEEMICYLTGAHYALATVNGTAALHAALIVTGVEQDSEVLTQPVSFVATANAIAYCNAHPVFIGVEHETLGLSPTLLHEFLSQHAEMRRGSCYNRGSGRRITACVPMHTFGHPNRIDKIVEVCSSYNIPVVEDAAEAFGSYYKEKHCGTFGLAGVFSFNGNKIVTAGGGGALVTNDAVFAQRFRHITTTAKKQHEYKLEHNEVGYNYRLPNINAALCCAQLEQLPEFLEKKRAIAMSYKDFFADDSAHFHASPPEAKSNYWLNAVSLKNVQERDQFLHETNREGIMTRPLWELLYTLPMFKHCQVFENDVAEDLARRVVNLPSGVPGS